MADGARIELDARLARGFAERGFIDSRDAYRDRLRELKAVGREAFGKAVQYFETTVTPRILSGQDPIDAWIEYGGMLASLTDAGELMAVDTTGMAWPYGSPARSDHLILFVPETGRAGFIVARPVEVSEAQSATIQLLVENRLSLR
jgi:hypothetical protein